MKSTKGAPDSRLFTDCRPEPDWAVTIYDVHAGGWTAPTKPVNHRPSSRQIAMLSFSRVFQQFSACLSHLCDRLLSGCAIDSSFDCWSAVQRGSFWGFRRRRSGCDRLATAIHIVRPSVRPSVRSFVCLSVSLSVCMFAQHRLIASSISSHNNSRMKSRSKQASNVKRSFLCQSNYLDPNSQLRTRDLITPGNLRTTFSFVIILEIMWTWFAARENTLSFKHRSTLSVFVKWRNK